MIPYKKAALDNIGFSVSAILGTSFSCVSIDGTEFSKAI